MLNIEDRNTAYTLASVATKNARYSTIIEVLSLVPDMPDEQYLSLITKTMEDIESSSQYLTGKYKVEFEKKKLAFIVDIWCKLCRIPSVFRQTFFEALKKSNDANIITKVLVQGALSKKESNILLTLPLIKDSEQNIFSICVSDAWHNKPESLLPLIKNLKSLKFGPYWAKEILCRRKGLPPGVSNKLLEIVLLAEYPCQAYDLLKYVPNLLEDDEREACIELIKSSDDTTLKGLAVGQLQALTQQECDFLIKK